MSTIFVLLFLFCLIALPISLIKPSLFTKLSKGLISKRKRAIGIFGGGVLAFFILIGITAPETKQAEGDIEGVSIESQQETITPALVPNPSAELPPLDIPSPSPSLSPSPTPTPTPTPKASIKPSNTPTPKPTSTPEPTISPTPTPASVTTSSGSTPSYGGGDKDCKDFSSHAEAQSYFESKGGSPSNNVDDLDRDNDGIACESLK